MIINIVDLYKQRNHKVDNGVYYLVPEVILPWEERCRAFMYELENDMIGNLYSFNTKRRIK